MKYLAAFLLALCLPASAQAPDASKPVTNLVVMVTGDIRTQRPMVVQWWHDEDICKKAAFNLNKQAQGIEPSREFICVKLLRDEV